jgi:hypothetical protein
MRGYNPFLARRIIKALADLLKLAISTVSFPNPARRNTLLSALRVPDLKSNCRNMECACRQ